MEWKRERIQKNGENKLIIETEFEGEYMNGKKWNGNGYDNKNNIAYTLKNGNGLIKEYYYERFEGEYLNGKRNGKGKVYYQGEKVIFEGVY